ncbi:3'-5' exonuclease, partial [Veillonella atypica]
MTVHQAKGSVFDHVFLAGMNLGTFPSFMSLREGN